MTYEIRARFERSEYVPIDWADDEEAAKEKVETYAALLDGWQVWYKKVEGKAFHPQRFT